VNSLSNSCSPTHASRGRGGGMTAIGCSAQSASKLMRASVGKALGDAKATNGMNQQSAINHKPITDDHQHMLLLVYLSFANGNFFLFFFWHHFCAFLLLLVSAFFFFSFAFYLLCDCSTLHSHITHHSAHFQTQTWEPW